MRTLAVALLFLSGCAIVAPMSPSARAQETATELNVNSRFGRMELATEHVAPSHREAWLQHHRAWGGNVRVADYEMAGFKMKGDNEAETLVRLSWYRLEQGDLRNTMLKQTWHQTKGAWQLTEEKHADGDVGLLGEPPPAPPPGSAPADTTPKKAAQFPTIRLGSTENAPTTASD